MLLTMYLCINVLYESVYSTSLGRAPYHSYTGWHLGSKDIQLHHCTVNHRPFRHLLTNWLVAPIILDLLMDRAITVPVNISTALIKWLGLFLFLTDINWYLYNDCFEGYMSKHTETFCHGMEWVAGVWTMLWLPQVAMPKSRETSWTLTIYVPGPVTEESLFGMTLWKCASSKKTHHQQQQQQQKQRSSEQKQCLQNIFGRFWKWLINETKTLHLFWK